MTYIQLLSFKRGSRIGEREPRGRTGAPFFLSTGESGLTTLDVIRNRYYSTTLFHFLLRLDFNITDSTTIEFFKKVLSYVLFLIFCKTNFNISLLVCFLFNITALYYLLIFPATGSTFIFTDFLLVFSLMNWLTIMKLIRSSFVI